MARIREGYIYQDKRTGKWIARVDFKDIDGKERTFRRQSKENSEKAANTLRQEILVEIEYRLNPKLVPPYESNISFRDFAQWYKEKYVVPPVYEGETKIAGQRAWKGTRLIVDALIKYFGDRPLKEIKYSNLEQFKTIRLNTKTIVGRKRKIASVNRDLAVMKRILSIAVRDEYIDKNPFKAGDSLINTSLEEKRERVLSDEEEERLLDAYREPVRVHQLPLILVALDCGLRRNEILSLVVGDLDLDKRLIRVKKLNSKTNQLRYVGMTQRVYKELFRISQKAKPEKKLFPYKYIRNSFLAARRKAGIEGLRFHDLRHTFCSRAIAAGVPAEQAARVSGHSQMSTFYRYTNIHTADVIKVAEALDRFNQGEAETDRSPQEQIHKSQESNNQDNYSFSAPISPTSSDPQLTLLLSIFGKRMVISEKEFCLAVGISLMTALRLRTEGQLDYYQQGKRVFYGIRHMSDYLKRIEVNELTRIQANLLENQ